MPPPLTPQNLQQPSGSSSAGLEFPLAETAAAAATLLLGSGEHSASQSDASPTIRRHANNADDELVQHQQLSHLLEDYDDFMSISSMCTADNMSLLSIDMSNASFNVSGREEGTLGTTLPAKEPGTYDVVDVKEQATAAEVKEKDETAQPQQKIAKAEQNPTPHIAYRGIMAQIDNIPSIACDNSITEEDQVNLSADHDNESSTVFNPPR